MNFTDFRAELLCPGRESNSQPYPCLFIALSLSQIIDSEMVFALQKGRVEQSGHPDEVYRRGGIYKDIVDASARSLNIEKIARTVGT